MVHPVHDGVCSWHQVGRTLRYICQEMKNPFPKPVHRKHFVRGITVMEKCLEKNGAEPMRREKTENSHV